MKHRKPRPEPSFRCCQHGAYAFILVNGIRHARCQVCGHCWMVFVGEGDTDYLAADMPGIALR